MIIAIDVGGTKISAALIADAKILEQRKIPSIIHTDLTNLSQYLIELSQDWALQATHIGIACTGQVGERYVNFLSAKKKLPLKAQLESAFKLPVTIINDAAAACWAEYHFIKNSTIGTDPTNNNNETLVYITVSTGIGGGIVQNGRLITSTDGFCAHLGHVSVQNSSHQVIHCHCGRNNCAEAIASGTSIAKQASLVLDKKVTCKEYSTVNEIAIISENASSAVCDLIANIKAVTGTEKVILGGSVGSSAIFQQQVISKVAKLPLIYQVSISPPQMGANADLIGAYYYVQQNT
jgi:N-acylmannosamine kinase